MGEIMTQPLNAKGKPFSWSFSRMNDFDGDGGCPARYAGTSFYCTVPYHESPEARWGNRVHKAAEYMLKNKPVEDEEALKPVEEYCTVMIRSGNVIEAETQLALSRNLTPVSWFSSAAWLRIQIDVIMTKLNGVCSLYDWKTGRSLKTIDDQLRLAAAALALVRPKYQRYEGRYIWTQHKKVVPIAPIDKSDCRGIWEEMTARAHRMEEAWRTENFPPRPSGLCPWCKLEGCKARRGEMRK
jgi:hypothetical protein